MLNNVGKSDFSHILVDTNGVKKLNVFGKDVFTFILALNDKKPLKSWGCSDTTRGIAIKCCKNDSSKCTGLLEFDNWEFKKGLSLAIICLIKNKIIRNVKKNLQNPEKLLL